MRTLLQTVPVALVLLILALLPSSTSLNDRLPTVKRSDARGAFSDLPMLFEKNLGQADPGAHFLSRGQGYTFFVAPGEATLVLRGTPEAHVTEPGTLVRQRRGISRVLRMKLVGGNAQSTIGGTSRTETAVNYFVGKDPDQWTRNVPAFLRLENRDVYPGIDLVYRGTGGELEYDFIVSPGADPSHIRMRLEGPDRLHLDRGSLVAEFGDRKLVQRPPSIYQEIDGEREPIQGSFVMTEDREVRFDIGRYDTARPLVIDPVLTYSSYLGGSGRDTPLGITVDAQGNTFVVGSTASIDFPGADPADVDAGAGDDAFLVKINASGSGIDFANYIGGESLDAARAVTLGDTGNIFVAGATDSPDFPVKGALQPESNGFFDVFISVFSASGNTLLLSTYLGGERDDVATAIALDKDENMVVTGESNSVRFPTASAIQPIGLGTTDAFIAKLNADGTSPVFSTYLGFDGGSGRGVVVDDNSNIWVTGLTGSSSSPTQNPTQTSLGGSFDAFVTRFSADGSLLFSTFLGGSNTDIGSGIAVDRSGNVYVTGETDSTDFPTANAFQPTHAGGTDAFIAKFKSDGSSLLSSSFLGGTGTDAAIAVAADSYGDVVVAGSTNSTNFPTMNAIQPASGGGNDGFVSRFDSTIATLLYSTYLGGTGQDAVGHMVVDAGGNVYVTGTTDSTDFPTASALQSSPGGQGDGFLWKVGSDPTTFAVSDRGGMSVATADSGGVLQTGHSRVRPSEGSTAPAGVAIFGFRPDSVLLSEAGVPASGAMLAGRIYAEVAGVVTTGVAIANPSSQNANVTFFFTDSTGNNFGNGTFILEANQQMAKFLDQEPFNGGSSINGTFTFISDVPVAVVALRGLTNERGEFLITTLPVATLVPGGTDTIFFPHFAVGGGWTTQVILTNPTDGTLAGEVRFFGPGIGETAGEGVPILLDDGRVASRFDYAIAPRTSLGLRTVEGASLVTGSVRVTPSAGSTAPVGVSVFSLRSNGVVVTEAGVPAQTAGSGFRLYAEAFGNPGSSGSILTGVAITIASSTPTTATIELTRPDGSSLGLPATAVPLPPSGQIADFIDAWFPTLSGPFSGILRITSNNPVAVVGLRSRTNERNDFLITTTPPSRESDAGNTSDLFFPHFADGNGWTTQFILFSGAAGQSSSGSLGFLNSDGLVLGLPVS